MRIYAAMLLAMVTYFAADCAKASAWMKKKGERQLAVTTSHYKADKYVNTHAWKTSIPAFRKSEVNPYLEYGVSDALTVGANIFLDEVSQGGNTNYALTDTELFFRRPLYSGNALKISYQPLIKLPSISSSVANGRLEPLNILPWVKN